MPMTHDQWEESQHQAEQAELAKRYAESLGGSPTLTPAEQIRRNYLAHKEAMEDTLPPASPTAASWQDYDPDGPSGLTIVWFVATSFIPILLGLTHSTYQYEHAGAESNFAIGGALPVPLLVILWAAYAVLTFTAGVAALFRWADKQPKA